MSQRRHSFSTAIVSRHPNVWRASCGKHATWDGPTYEAVEDSWRQHVYDETGVAPKAYGDKTNARWQP